MLLGSLPLDYLQHLGRHDRIRRTRTRPTGSRIRRGTATRRGSSSMPTFETPGNVALRVALT